MTADLLFAARIRGAAEQAGVVLRLAGPRDDVVAVAATWQPRLLLLDLDARWLDPVALIGALRAHPSAARVLVIAYVSHVREDAIASARAAGADRVLARSAFVRLLPQLLRDAVSGSASTPP